MTIKTPLDFQKVLKEGPWAWPGGYPLYFVCRDCEPLCFDCAKKNTEQIIEAIHFEKSNEQWEVIGVDINWENDSLICSNCENKIESAYGE